MKIKFYRTYNCIYSRSNATNFEMVTVELLKAYCWSLLSYASESVLLTSRQLHVLNNCINREVFKICRVSNGNTVKDERNFVGLDDVAILAEKRLIDSGEYGN